MADISLQVILNIADCRTSGIGSREEVEEPVHETLCAAALGEVASAEDKGKYWVLNVDIEHENNLDRSIRLIRDVLRSLSVPESSCIQRIRRDGTIHAVYE